MNKKCIQTIQLKFTEKFSKKPLLIFSPGRINLIGEHTDYNNGFVFPAATDKGMYAAIEKSESNYIETTLETDLVESKTSKKGLEKNESPFEELVLPTLYSKKAIQGFTIFFTTIFGAVLLMKNLKEMNKPKARIQVLVFGIIYTLISGIILNLIPKSIFLTLLFNLIGYAVLVEFFWNKNLGKALKYRNKQI